MSSTQHVNQKKQGPAGSRVDSQNSRNDVHERRIKEQLNCYTDEENAMLNFQNRTNSGSLKNHSRVVKAQTTKGNLNRPSTLHRDDLHNFGPPGHQIQGDKTLYTNISLREMSQSPETRQPGLPNYQTKSNTRNPNLTDERMYQNTQIIQNKRIIQNSSQDRTGQPNPQLMEHQDLFNNKSFSNYQSSSGIPNLKNHNLIEGGVQASSSQGQFDLQTDLELKNYINNMQQTEKAGDKKDKNGNGAILNIKTVQDINIYNNSFIVNSGNLP